MSQDVYTKKTNFGVFYSNQYPQKIKNGLKFSVVFFFAFAVACVVLFFSLASEYGLSTGAPFVLVMALFFSIFGYVYIRQLKKLDEEYYAFLREVEQLKAKKAKEEAYRKEHEDELFYQECAKNNILTTNKADAARMKIVAKQMDISCSDDELIQKFLRGMSITNENELIAAEKERKARIPVLRKEEQRVEQEGKKYINLVGSDKRVRMFLDEAARHRAIVAQYERAGESITKGADALYSLHAGKETDWAIHGGVASAIAGSAAGVAVAVDIQRKNAEVRASNAQLRQSIGQFSAEQQLNMWMKQSEAEEKMKYYEAEAEKAKLKLVETLPQDDLLKLLYPIIEKKQTSETGAITFTVSVNKASLTIFDTVNAVVDGSFKVKVMDGDRLAGEAYFTLPYNGSQRSSTLTSICASLPAEEKKYTFVFAPHNLFAIEL